MPIWFMSATVEPVRKTYQSTSLGPEICVTGDARPAHAGPLSRPRLTACCGVSSGSGSVQSRPPASPGVGTTPPVPPPLPPPVPPAAQVPPTQELLQHSPPDKHCAPEFLQLLPPPPPPEPPPVPVTGVQMLAEQISLVVQATQLLPPLPQLFWA